MQDEVEKPDHYQFGSIEAWDIIELAVMDIADPVTAYHVASALKYLLRAARKGGNTDIAKASAHLKRETARHVTAAPDYDPASVAFRDGDLDKVCGHGAVAEERTYRIGGHPPRTAAEIAQADGCAEYGNPVTPSCAISFAQTRVNAKDISHYATRQSDSGSVSYGGKRP